MKFKGGSLAMTRSYGAGPSAILNVEWKNQTFTIDIVACVRGTDVSGLRYLTVLRKFCVIGSK